MKRRPILFSTPMVQAILEGRKTQTRRVVKPQPANTNDVLNLVNDDLQYKSPFGQVGDVLWIRETWAKTIDNDYVFKANNPYTHLRFKPSIHMPKEACRLFLQIKSVRVERLLDISEQDAKAEGVLVDRSPNYPTLDIYKNYLFPKDDATHYIDPISSFKSLWQKINGAES
jgi:hypothetical protein